MEGERNQGENKVAKKVFVGVAVCFLLLLLSFVCVGRLVSHKADAGSCGRERQERVKGQKESQHLLNTEGTVHRLARLSL